MPVEPVVGRPYDWTLVDAVTCEGDMPAFCSNTAGKSWADSSFDLSAFAGEAIWVELHYSTNNSDTNEGFYLDDVRVTNAVVAGCDGLECAADPTCIVPEFTLDPVTACSGLPVTLQASFDFFGVGTFEFEWDFGDGDRVAVTVADAPIDHVYAAAGTYFARINARSVSDPHCSSSASIEGRPTL